MKTHTIEIEIKVAEQSAGVVFITIDDENRDVAEEKAFDYIKDKISLNVLAIRTLEKETE